MVRDDRARVEQAGREIAPHLLPRVVHLPADDAVHGDPLEDDLGGEVDGHDALADAEQLYPTAPADRGERPVHGGRYAPPLAPPVDPGTPRSTPYLTPRL